MCQSHAPVGTVTMQNKSDIKITPSVCAANRVSHKINYEVVLSTHCGVYAVVLSTHCGVYAVVLSTHCGVYAVVLGRIELQTYLFSNSISTNPISAHPFRDICTIPTMQM